jgi:hypothetical protein
VGGGVYKKGCRQMNNGGNTTYLCLKMGGIKENDRGDEFNYDIF